jgi:hypothetical protein
VPIGCECVCARARAFVCVCVCMCVCVCVCLCVCGCLCVCVCVCVCMYVHVCTCNLCVCMCYKEILYLLSVVVLQSNGYGVTAASTKRAADVLMVCALYEWPAFLKMVLGCNGYGVRV